MKQWRLLIALATLALPAGSQARTAPALAGGIGAAEEGQRGFDWEIGTWMTHVRVLRNPLSGEAPDWVSYEGTSVVKPLMGGRANFVELSVRGARGAIEGGSLRLYNPKGRQWSLNYANLANGLLTSPVFGQFDHSGRGVFFGQDQLAGRTILVRFIVTRPSSREARFEQSYSDDGGTTWETNWVAVDTRP